MRNIVEQHACSCKSGQMVLCSKLQGNVVQHPDSELPRQSVLVFMEVWA